MPSTFTSIYTSPLTSMCFSHLPPTHVCWDSRTRTHVANTYRCCCCHAFGFALSLVSSAGSPGPEVPLSREEEVDSTLLKNDSGVESALLYAKAWSKYIKDLLAWMEKRLAMGETNDTHQSFVFRFLAFWLLIRFWNGNFWYIRNIKSFIQKRIAWHAWHEMSNMLWVFVYLLFNWLY